MISFFSVSALLFMVFGCDTESVDENNIYITPETATIAEGESISFTATGGFEYRWSLGADGTGTWATLSNREGPSTIYTSLRNSASNGVPTVRTLLVSSYIVGTGSASNANEASYAETHTAEAYITHIANP